MKRLDAESHAGFEHFTDDAVWTTPTVPSDRQFRWSTTGRLHRTGFGRRAHLLTRRVLNESNKIVSLQREQGEPERQGQVQAWNCSTEAARSTNPESTQGTSAQEGSRKYDPQKGGLLSEGDYLLTGQIDRLLRQWEEQSHTTTTSFNSYQQQHQPQEVSYLKPEG